MPIEANFEEEDHKIARKILKLLRKAESTSHEAEADAFGSKARELMERHSLSRGEVERAEFRVVTTRDAQGYKRSPPWKKNLHWSVTDFLGVYHVYTRSPGEVAEWTWVGVERDIKMARYMIDALVAQIKDLTEQWKSERRERRRELAEKIERAESEIERREKRLRELEPNTPKRREVLEKKIRWKRRREKMRETKASFETGKEQTGAFRVGLMERIHERLHRMVDDVSGGRAEKALVHQGEQDEKWEQARELYLEVAGQEPSSSNPAAYRDAEAYASGYQQGDNVQVRKGAEAGPAPRRLAGRG